MSVVVIIIVIITRPNIEPCVSAFLLNCQR